MISRKPIHPPGLSSNSVFPITLALTLTLCAVLSWLFLDRKVLSVLSQNSINWNRNFWLEELVYLGKAWVLIWLVLIWFLATGRRRTLLITLVALIMTSLTVVPLKGVSKRQRPCDIIKAGSNSAKEHSLYSHTSFPSGDTAVAFAAAMVIIFLAPRRYAPLLLVVSVAVGGLRVISKAHYPSDVFAGAAIGVLAAWLALQIDKRWELSKNHRLNINRTITILAIIIIPLSFGLSEGMKDMLIFLSVYGPLGVCVFLAAKCRKVI